MSASPFKPLPYRLRAELYMQLAQMEMAGLPFDKAFALLELAAPAKLRLEATKKLTARGIDPAKAGERSGLFTRLEARLIQAALNAGSPAAMYRRLGDFYTRRAMQIATMKSRLVMPAFVLLLALCIQPLPALIGGSIGAGGYLLQVLRPVLVLAALFYTGRWLWNHLLAESAVSSREPLLLRVPLFGALTVRSNLRDFFESLALMLEAGVSMLDALPVALDTLQVGAMRREFAGIAPRIENGAALAGAMSGMAYLTRANNGDRLIEFIRTGEASGTLPEMLMRHTAMETASINDFLQQLAEWTPRLFYGLIVVWMAYGLLTGGGFMPRVPKDL
jgi:general secretion pathway protein F